MGNEIYNKFKGKTKEEFLELLIRAENEPIIDGVKMPGFPDIDFQRKTVGSRGADDLKFEAYWFTNAVRTYSNQYGVDINENTRILDFGVGWGRMLRFFFKDTPSDNLYGTDTWQRMIDECNKLLPAGNYSINEPHPPIKYADSSFDIIISYSVFSHLRADAAEAWIKEFARILKPNGIVVATTEGLRFLGLIEWLQSDPNHANGNEWYSLLLEGYNEPIAEYRKRYSAGEFIYVPSGGGEALDSSFYGDAIVPEKYIKEAFGKYLKLKDFADDKKMAQAIFALQKQGE